MGVGGRANLLGSCLIMLNLALPDEKNQTILLCVGGTFTDFNSGGMHMFILAGSGVRRTTSHNTFNLYLSNIQLISFIDLKS